MTKQPVQATQHTPFYSTTEMLERVILDEFKGKVALVSSFGIESAVLLHLVAQVDRTVPVLFIDTFKLFPETLSYRQELTKKLGLSNVQIVQADTDTLHEKDPYGNLWRYQPDACCHMRKVEPLQKAITPYTAWITGRKRYHGGEREALRIFEPFGNRMKINPLAAWSQQDIHEYMVKHALPAHPLASRGYSSVGCLTCTAKACDESDVRAGRWSGSEKTECGIHYLYEKKKN